MPQLSISGQEIESVFSLLGDSENDLTYSLGYALANSPLLLETLLSTLGVKVTSLTDIHIHLQTRQKENGTTDNGTGITDIEIVGDSFHIIIEAKRHWKFPTIKQLQKYAKRHAFAIAATQKLVVLNACDSIPFQQVAFPYPTLPNSNVPIEHLSWGSVLRMAQALGKRGREGFILNELISYLRSVLIMARRDSNSVFVVPLSSNPVTMQGSSITMQQSSIAIYQTMGLYFHPLGNGWPVDPPNYIAFRFNGQLQGVHHVDSTQIFNDVNQVPELRGLASQGSIAPHILYRLGPNLMCPGAVVRTGTPNPQNGKHWIDIDLLLSNDTVMEAHRKTMERRAKP
jgi:hypothetical protein